MANADFQWGGSAVTGGDIPFKNTDVSAMSAGQAVKVDPTNVMSGTQAVAGALIAAAGDKAVGYVIEAIPVNGIGRVRVYGVAPATASGAITAGVAVAPDASGKTKTCPAATAQSGYALTSAATNGDTILVLVDRGNNA